MVRNFESHYHDIEGLLSRTNCAIAALEEYNGALDKLNKYFHSEAEDRLIKYGDVRDSIERLKHMQQMLDRVLRAYENVSNCEEQDCLLL